MTRRYFFQAEDGIRDYKVTGVQTCALPISGAGKANHPSPKIVGVIKKHHANVREPMRSASPSSKALVSRYAKKIGRASCRGRGEGRVGDVTTQRTEREKVESTGAGVESDRR